MRRIPPNNPVRRRLFPADDNEAISDNFLNDLQESFDRERKEKMEKWNFDFQNDKPLEGRYSWVPFDEPEAWVGYDFGTTVEEPIEEFLTTVIQDQMTNEMTPKVKDENSEPKLNKKRKSAASNITVQRLVRRRLDYKEYADACNM